MKGQSLARFVAALKRQLATAESTATATESPLRLHRVEADIEVIAEGSPETEGGVRLLARSCESDDAVRPGSGHRIRLEFTAREVGASAPAVHAAPTTSSPVAAPAPAPAPALSSKSVLADLGVEFRTLDQLSRSEKLPSYLRALLVRKDLPEADKALVLANLLTLEGDLARHGFVGDILMALDAAELERRLAKTGSAAPPKQ